MASPFRSVSIALFALVGALVILPSKAAAQTSAPALADADLASLRGGFLVAGGVTFDFGAVVRTYVDGTMALESRLTWTDTGPVVGRTIGAVPGTVDLAAAFDQGVFGGIDLTALRGAQGILLSDARGTTALVQSLQGGVRSFVVNAADGRDLRQEIEITLTLPDLAAMQTSGAVDRLGAMIGQDVTAGLLQSLAR